MRGKVLRQPIKRLVDQIIIGDRRLSGRKALKPCRALTIIGEQAVNVGSDDAAVG